MSNLPSLELATRLAVVAPAAVCQNQLSWAVTVEKSLDQLLPSRMKLVVGADCHIARW